MTISLDALRGAEGLSADEGEMLEELIELWQAKLTRNQLRVRYYESKNRLKDLGIAIPPPLKDVETVVGWPAKAVDILAMRSRFDGFVLDSGDDAAVQICNDNHLKALYFQAVQSELIHSCAFVTVSRGGRGEPSAVVSVYSALYAAALWNDRLKRIRCGLAVIDMDRKPHKEPEPTWVNLYTDDATVEIVKEGDRWVAHRNPHSMGRPMMEPLVYRPSLDRPFGKSRISRAVMSITDSAVRCALRSEVSSEFFTAPQKYLLGADDSTFAEKSKWEAYIGNIWALGKDEDGELPQVGQFSQASMQPHTDYMRSLAARFSGETSIPVSELGVIHDNPSSAEAIYAAKESLVSEAEILNTTNGEALKTVGQMALAASQNKGLEDLTDDERTIQARFKNPAAPSIVSQADAMVKIVSAMPWIADSQIALEELGFSEDQIMRLMSDKRRAEATARLEAQSEPKEGLDASDMYRVKSIVQSYNNGSISLYNAVNLFALIGVDEEEATLLLQGGEEIEDTLDEMEENGGDTQGEV